MTMHYIPISCKIIEVLQSMCNKAHRAIYTRISLHQLEKMLIMLRKRRKNKEYGREVEKY